MNDLTENLTDAPLPISQETNLSKLIEKTARLFPDKIAAIYRDEQLTYTELVALSNQFANYLLAGGIKQGDIIGLAVECSIEMLICMIGLLRAGAVYVPLDPKYPQERIEYMLRHSGAKMLIITEVNHGRYKTTATERTLTEIWSELKNYSIDVSDTDVFDSGLAYVLYTSGSTGKPKGVEITHANLINLLTSVQSKPGITSEDRLLAITTISFDIAGLELFLPLITGAELIISDLETARDGRLLLDILEEKNITIMQATPSTWRMMLDSGWEKKYPIKIFCGGEPLPKDLAGQLLEKSSELWNMYGPTETTIYSVIKQIQKEDKIITIGWPINNTQIYLFDENMELVPNGDPGEIYIGGAGVSAGYLNQPELTDERFVTDIYSVIPNAKLYRTGDIGKFLANQDLEFLGRIDQQVKIRGHRIELGEIENILAKHPMVKQSMVIVREDNPEDKRLTAYLVLNDHTDIPLTHNILEVPKSVIDSFKEIIRQNLPDYMLPNDYVVLQAFPLTLNHKVDKKQLPKPLAKSLLLHVSHLPKNDNERIVASIFSQALGIKNISIKDDFFDLGGNSLSAVKIMAAIEKETGKRLPLAALFDNTTIEKMARRISSNQVERWQALVPIKTTGSKPPVYLIHGGGLNIILFKAISEDLDPEQPAYGFQALGLNKPADIPDTIEQIATIYVAELLVSNPKGPYQLVGYSLGGFIAWEMAKQLKAIGKEIKFLAILDTYAGNADQFYNPVLRLAIKLKRQFLKIPFLIKSFMLYPKEALAYQVGYFLNRLDGIEREISDVAFFTPYEKQIYSTYKNAQKTYRIRPADLQVHVFRVFKRLYYLDDLIQLGWGRFAKNGVKVNVIPGDHKTFLYPPNDRAFAKILQTELDKV